MASVGFSFVMSSQDIGQLEVEEGTSEEDPGIPLRNVLKDYVLNTQCVLDTNQFLNEIGRPIYNCSVGGGR